MLLCNMTSVSHYDVIMCLGNIWHLVIKVLSISQQKLKINSILLNWLQKCPTPLHFNAETKLCDDPQFAGCETMTTTTPAVTSTQPPAFSTGKSGVILCLPNENIVLVCQLKQGLKFLPNTTVQAPVRSLTQTRTHSSRMRTVRTLSYKGRSPWQRAHLRETLPGQGPPWTEISPCEQNHRQV